LASAIHSLTRVGAAGHSAEVMPPGNGWMWRFPEGAGALVVGRLRMRRDVPNQCHRELVDVSQSGERDASAVGPPIALERVPVDLSRPPPGSHLLD
jgi:hypothetical protein